MTAPNNLERFAVYDALNRVVEQSDSLSRANGKSTVFRYDAVGNLEQKTDLRGSSWEYQYYDDNSLKNLTVSGLDGTSYTVDYQYDEAGNRKQVSDSEAHRIKYNYNGTSYQTDPLNRINSIDRTFDSTTYRTAYQYDPAGLLTGIMYPQATAMVEYKYNSRRRWPRWRKLSSLRNRRHCRRSRRER